MKLNRKKLEVYAQKHGFDIPKRLGLKKTFFLSPTLGTYNFRTGSVRICTNGIMHFSLALSYLLRGKTRQEYDQEVCARMNRTLAHELGHHVDPNKPPLMKVRIFNFLGAILLSIIAYVCLVLVPSKIIGVIVFVFAVDYIVLPLYRAAPWVEIRR
jgi:hypothetical protein